MSKEQNKSTCWCLRCDKVIKWDNSLRSLCSDCKRKDKKQKKIKYKCWRCAVNVVKRNKGPMFLDECKRCYTWIMRERMMDEAISSANLSKWPGMQTVMVKEEEVTGD